jgi:hypothetical protein
MHCSFHLSPQAKEILRFFSFDELVTCRKVTLAVFILQLPQLQKFPLSIENNFHSFCAKDEFTSCLNQDSFDSLFCVSESDEIASVIAVQLVIYFDPL